jgi:hypothetical protein
VRNHEENSLSPLDEFCQKHGLPEAHGTFIVNDSLPCEPTKWRVVAVNGKTVISTIGG